LIDGLGSAVRAGNMATPGVATARLAWSGIAVRLILGIPLGSDISSGYTYIMESMPRGEREVMGNRWQFMFALG
jgi:MFS family permease